MSTHDYTRTTGALNLSDLAKQMAQVQGQRDDIKEKVGGEE